MKAREPGQCDGSADSITSRPQLAASAAVPEPQNSQPALANPKLQILNSVYIRYICCT